MNLEQLTGRHIRLRRKLLSTYRALPRNTGRIARLTHELAATERMISMARAAMGAATGSRQSGNRSRTNVANAPTPRGQRRDGARFAPTIPCMENKHSSHQWLGRFAGRLLQLRPSMHVGMAVQQAVMSIHDAADLDPHRAAELLVLATPNAEAVVERSAARPTVTHASRYQAMFGVQTTTQTSDTPQPASVVR